MAQAAQPHHRPQALTGPAAPEPYPAALALQGSPGAGWREIFGQSHGPVASLASQAISGAGNSDSAVQRLLAQFAMRHQGTVGASQLHMQQLGDGELNDRSGAKLADFAERHFLTMEYGL